MTGLLLLGSFSSYACDFADAKMKIENSINENAVSSKGNIVVQDELVSIAPIVWENGVGGKLEVIRKRSATYYGVVSKLAKAIYNVDSSCSFERESIVNIEH